MNAKSTPLPGNTAERVDGPEHTGCILLTEVLAVKAVGTSLEVATKYRRLVIEPLADDLALWHLRLQEPFVIAM